MGEGSLRKDGEIPCAFGHFMGCMLLCSVPLGNKRARTREGGEEGSSAQGPHRAHATSDTDTV